MPSHASAMLVASLLCGLFQCVIAPSGLTSFFIDTEGSSDTFHSAHAHAHKQMATAAAAAAGVAAATAAAATAACSLAAQSGLSLHMRRVCNSSLSVSAHAPAACASGYVPKGGSLPSAPPKASRADQL
eukprot:4316141-Pleurochrysis_carterae.AAC.2